MKIQFDIKFRPQIESGEYKVVTGDDRPVRIISWDKRIYGGRYEIVALVPTPQGDTETVQLYCPDGTLLSSSYNGKFKLFIVTPEPELTEFEQEVCTVSNLCLNLEMKDEIRSAAKQLLAIAKKELCKECAANLDGYVKGRLDAMKEMDKVYKHECPTPPVYWPPCYYGGPCTNPCYDCINCPRRAITVSCNTTTGTSAAKVEGKE